MDEAKLLEKLQRIEALFSGATTPGERGAAAEARGRILARLAAVQRVETAIEHVFRIHDPWSRELFLALLRRWELVPYRYARQRAGTIQVKVPKAFVHETLWPAFRELDSTLHSYLHDVTSRVISEALYRGGGDAEVRSGAQPTLAAAPPLLGRGEE